MAAATDAGMAVRRACFAAKIIATIVFNPGVALLVSMTASSCQQSVSISRRSSGLSGGTGKFRVFRHRADLRNDLKGCS